MNRFRTKKKAKESSDVDKTTIAADEAIKSMTPLKPSKTFRIGKKNVPEPAPKPELDLASALPSSDDFRTSLLMSGLSARFSMLREQDDPSSKIGKASDDSVLFPKRQSRMADFGYTAGGLSDIAEVSSIYSNARPRPPFTMERVESFLSVDGYGTDDDSTIGGSVMSRAKPAHGNNLFGGRQKIYKIPTGASSAKSLAANQESGAMRGRVLYDDDVSMSAFQKLREKEKQEQRELEDQQDFVHSSPPRRSSSPPLSGYNKNRETSSTTASGPSLTRSSTAATSVTSQRTPSLNGHSNPSTPAILGQSNFGGGLERASTKTRRLYENGLDQHLHSQQHSAMSRLDSLSRQRTYGARTPSPSIPSPTFKPANIPERPEHEEAATKEMDADVDRRLGSFEFGTQRAEVLDVPSSTGFGSPPLSPPMSDGDEQSMLPIQPNDIGKATAAGVFTKPVQPYDENRYAQRQLQMQGGRATPPLRKHSPPRHAQNVQNFARNRAESNSTYSSGRSRSSSSVQGLHVIPNRTFVPLQARNDLPQIEQEVQSPGTFLASPDRSSMGSPQTESEDGKFTGRPAPLQTASGNIVPPAPRERPSESTHPAFSERSPRLWADYTEDAADIQPTSNVNPATMSPEEKALVSPTLPELGSGLSGMVRQHLRSDSNSSSIYGAPSPAINTRFPLHEDSENHYSGKNNVWDANEWPIDYSAPPKFGTAPKSSSPTPGPKSGSLAKEIDNDDDTESNLWSHNMTPQHNREGSSATQKERDEFKNELATRRRRVQENLRNFAGPDSRAASPAPLNRSRDTSKTRSPAPIVALRQSPSRTSIVDKPKEAPVQTKAMKMLGIGASTMNSGQVSPNPRSSEDKPWTTESDETIRGMHGSPLRAPPDPKAIRQARRDAQRNRERDVELRHQHKQAPTETGGRSIYERSARFRQRDPSQEGRNVESTPYNMAQGRQGRLPPMNQQRSPIDVTSMGSRPMNQHHPGLPSNVLRDRSNSELSAGRSQSCGRTYRDDLARAQAEGVSSSTHTSHEEIVAARAPVRSPVIQESSSSSPKTANNAGNNGRMPQQGYFDKKGLQPIQTNTAADFTSPRPSPITPFSMNTTPALAQASPGGSYAGSTSGQEFQTAGRVSATRKRSVNKSEISEPTFVSSTARMPTVNLNEVEPLQNINAIVPPVPEFNPRRRQTRAQAMFGVFGAKSSDDISSPSLPQTYPVSDKSPDMAAESASSMVRQKLRKSSSEGGNMNARARAAFHAAQSPALPGQYPASAGIPPQNSQYDEENMF